MKKGICCACSLILMFSGGIFSIGYSDTLVLEPSTSTAGIAQLTTEQLTPGEPKTGSIPPAKPGSRMLGETQYTIQYPGAGAKLEVEFHPDFAVSFYLRRNLPVTMEGGKVVSDLGPFSSQKVSLPFNPPLDAATYFIAVENNSTRAVNFTLTANLVGPPTVDTVEIPWPSTYLQLGDRLELGSIQMPTPNECTLGGTQYAVSLPDTTNCDWATGWTIILRSDRNLNLYVRYGRRVAVEDGKVIADQSSKAPADNGVLSVSSTASATPMTRTYFIAVENCNSEATNYALTFRPRIPDLPPPSITSVFLEKKNLHVMGYFLDPSSIVLFDGEPQKTKYGGRVAGIPFAEDLLIVKKARNRIGRQTVTISVKLPGCITAPRQYTRP